MCIQQVSHRHWTAVVILLHDNYLHIKLKGINLFSNTRQMYSCNLIQHPPVPLLLQYSVYIHSGLLQSMFYIICLLILVFKPSSHDTIMNQLLLLVLPPHLTLRQNCRYCLVYYSLPRQTWHPTAPNVTRTL